MLSVGGFKITKQALHTIFGAKTGAFLNKLKYTYTPKIGPPQTITLYHTEGSCYVLPRTTMAILEKFIRVEVALPPLVTRAFTLIAELFDNQLLVVNHLQEYLTTAPIGKQTCVLNMQAGLGKTFIAGGIIAKLGLRTLYVVPKRPLMLQAVDDLRMCYTDPNEQAEEYNRLVDCGQAPEMPSFHYINAYDPKRDNSQDAITVIVINSAVKQPRAFFEGYSLVILDEVHMYCSDKRRTIFKQATAPVMIGMSATTADRKDGFDICTRYELCFDPVIMACDLPGWAAQEVEFKTEVTLLRYYGPPEYTHALTHESTGVLFTPYMHKQSASDPYRVRLAVQEITALFNEGHNIYVFAEEREMLGNLESALALSSVGRFIGGMKDTEVKEVAKRQILLTTYGFASTGVSIDKQTAIVFYTPRRANMKQILARILRRGGDTTITRRIIDIIDERTPMKHQLVSRMGAYEHYGMVCKKRRVTYEELQIITL